MPGRDEVGLRLGNSIPPVSQVQNCTTTKVSSVQAPTIGSVHDGNDDSVVRLFMNLLCMGYRISIHLCLTLFTYAASPQCNIKVVILKVASFFLTIHMDQQRIAPILLQMISTITEGHGYTCSILVCTYGNVWKHRVDYRYRRQQLLIWIMLSFTYCAY